MSSIDFWNVAPRPSITLEDQERIRVLEERLRELTDEYEGMSRSARSTPEGHATYAELRSLTAERNRLKSPTGRAKRDFYEARADRDPRAAALYYPALSERSDIDVYVKYAEQPQTVYAGTCLIPKPDPYGRHILADIRLFNGVDDSGAVVTRSFLDATGAPKPFLLAVGVPDNTDIKAINTELYMRMHSIEPAGARVKGVGMGYSLYMSTALAVALFSPNSQLAGVYSTQEAGERLEDADRIWESLLKLKLSERVRRLDVLRARTVLDRDSFLAWPTSGEQGVLPYTVDRAWKNAPRTQAKKPSSRFDFRGRHWDNDSALPTLPRAETAEFLARARHGPSPLVVRFIAAVLSDNGRSDLATSYLSRPDILAIAQSDSSTRQLLAQRGLVAGLSRGAYRDILRGLGRTPDWRSENPLRLPPLSRSAARALAAVACCQA